MKILFVADASIARAGSGTERVLYEQASRMAAAGHTVHLLTRLVPELHTAGKECVSGVTEWRYRADAIHPVRFVVDTFRNGGRLFRALHGKEGFDCLFFHQPLSARAVLSSGNWPLRKIYTCHSLWHEEYLSRNSAPSGMLRSLAVQLMTEARKRVERNVLDGADRIVALSTYTRERLRKAHGIPEDKISIVPGGVDLERFRPADDKTVIRRKLGLPENRIVLFTLRNLEPRMGLSELIRAMEIIRSRRSDIHLVVGGEGPLRASLLRQAEAAGLTPLVSFTGFIDEKDLPDYYRMADFFILPTRELEGFGLVTLEAMASGTPVLGTPVGGTREILEAFDRGCLFDDTSGEAMARLIIEKTGGLVNRPAAFEALRLQTRAFVESRYSWDRNIGDMLSLAAGEG